MAEAEKLMVMLFSCRNCGACKKVPATLGRYCSKKCREEDEA